MKVLVTGHHGYIGSVLAPMVRDAGHEVVGLDTFYYRGCDLGNDSRFEPALEIDVRSVSPQVLAGFDAVVHLAALSNDPLGDLDAEWTYSINFGGTMSLARAAKEAGVSRFIFASSCSMYGAAEGDDLVGEDAPLRPLTSYAESKVRAEEGLRELAGDGFSPVSMRNATAYGGVTASEARHRSQQSRGMGAYDGCDQAPERRHVVAAAGAHSGHRPCDARASRCACERACRRRVQHRLRRPELPHSRPRGDRPSSSSEVPGDLSRATPLPIHEAIAWTFRSSLRAFRECAFEWTAERGADELARAYDSVGLTLDDFEGGRYTRLTRLRSLLDEGALEGDLRWSSRGA